MPDQVAARAVDEVSDPGARLEAAFREAATNAIHQAHEANLPVPVVDDHGQLAWLHPDGVQRPTRDPVRIDTKA
ncbi:MAG: hypothetical protein EXR07_18525 [Acetobacteraceae bacterium]|nr:hypothetical protein [Acetobacteraceae bacterium]